MKRILWSTILILLAGGALLFWQHRLLMEAQEVSAERQRLARQLKAALPPSTPAEKLPPATTFPPAAAEPSAPDAPAPLSSAPRLPASRPEEGDDPVPTR